MRPFWSRSIVKYPTLPPVSLGGSTSIDISLSFDNLINRALSGAGIGKAIN
jgi:hypothetical protein